MAGRSPYQIVLATEERAELERRVACYTLPHKVVQRAKMVLYATEGATNVEIARRLETAPVLALRGGGGQGRLLHRGGFGLGPDENPATGAGPPPPPPLLPASGSRGQRVEHTYERRGALTYLAALDIGRREGRSPRVFGRSEPSGGIASFDRLVWQVLTKEGTDIADSPYAVRP